MTVQKLYVLGGFGYHGNLLVFFGFWFLVPRVSIFVCRYSRSGLECPFHTVVELAVNTTEWRAVNMYQYSRMISHQACQCRQANIHQAGCQFSLDV